MCVNICIYICINKYIYNIYIHTHKHEKIQIHRIVCRKTFM